MKTNCWKNDDIYDNKYKGLFIPKTIMITIKARSQMDDIYKRSSQKGMITILINIKVHSHKKTDNYQNNYKVLFTKNGW